MDLNCVRAYAPLSIRMENKTSPSTQLLFCTTGILLRRMEEDPELKGVTHLFV